MMVTAQCSVRDVVVWFDLFPGRSEAFLTNQLYGFDIVHVLTISEAPQGSQVAFSPVSILRKSISGRHRPVSYPDDPMTARYRFT